MDQNIEHYWFTVSNIKVEKQATIDDVNSEHWR